MHKLYTLKDFKDALDAAKDAHNPELFDSASMLIDFLEEYEDEN